MTHIETIRALTAKADQQRGLASLSRTAASSSRSEANEHEKAADAADLRAMAYEDSIDALQRLSTAEATA